jgi:hypothetical protein
MIAKLVSKFSAHHPDCARLASDSTLKRLELSRPESSKYRCISYAPAATEAMFGTIFIETHAKALEPIILYTVVSRKGGSSKALTMAAAIFRSTTCAVVICSRPSCGHPTSTGQPVPAKRSNALSRRSAPAGYAHRSCFALMAGSALRTWVNGAMRTASTIYSASRATIVWSVGSNRNRPRPPRKAARPAKPPDGSRTCATSL